MGFRSQSAVLTLPLLAFALLPSRPGFTTRSKLTAVGAVAAGVLLWAVPLVIATGGPRAYLDALGSQAGEDFSGVVMLWTHRTPKVAVFALLHSFVLPWDSPLLAGIVLALAAAGVWVLAIRAPRTLALTLLTFAPYAIFHLLFQETITVRYALPLMLPLAYFVSAVIAEAGTIGATAGTAALAIVSLWLAVPAGIAFGRTPSPVFAMLSRMQASGESAPIVAMHRRAFTESRRARQWTGLPPGRLLAAPRDYEWLELTRAWREAGASTPSWFVADPRRTDLALIDARGRRERVVPMALQRGDVRRRGAPERARLARLRQTGMVPRTWLEPHPRERRCHRARRVGTASAPERRLGSPAGWRDPRDARRTPPWRSV